MSSKPRVANQHCKLPKMDYKIFFLALVFSTMVVQAAQLEEDLEAKLESLESAYKELDKLHFTNIQGCRDFETKFCTPGSPSYDKHVADVFAYMGSLGHEKPGKLVISYALGQEIDSTKKKIQEKNEQLKVQPTSQMTTSSMESNSGNSNAPTSIPEESELSQAVHSQASENEIKVSNNFSVPTVKTVASKSQPVGSNTDDGSALSNTSNNQSNSDQIETNNTSNTILVTASKTGDSQVSNGKKNDNQAVPIYQQPLFIGGTVALLIAVAVTAFLLIRKNKSDEKLPTNKKGF